MAAWATLRLEPTEVHVVPLSRQLHDLKQRPRGDDVGPLERRHVPRCVLCIAGDCTQVRQRGVTGGLVVVHFLAEPH